MKKAIISGSCLVAGFLLFCLLHIAHLVPVYRHNYYGWMMGSILLIMGLVLGIIWLRKESVLPILASIFSFAPILLFTFGAVPFIGIIFVYVFFGSFWGLGFCVVGIILGIISLCMGIKYKKTGVILSIISIIAPFVWVLYLYLYVQNGGEILL